MKLNPTWRIQTVTQLRENLRRGRVVAGVGAFIVLFAIHLALTSHANTVTWDEPDHIYSGYMSWKGDFGLNPEHPPLRLLLGSDAYNAAAKHTMQMLASDREWKDVSISTDFK